MVILIDQDCFQYGETVDGIVLVFATCSEAECLWEW